MHSESVGDGSGRRIWNFEEKKAIKKNMHKAEPISCLILKHLIFFLNVISVFNNKSGK